MKRKEQYFYQLRNWKKKEGRQPIILLGARQVGKTYILKEFCEKEFSKLHYINFEADEGFAKIFQADLKPQRIISELEFYLHTTINQSTDVVFFDEIQQCPRALTALKYFCEEMPQLAVCCAGSLLGLCLGESSFPVGKVDLMHLYPFDFSEFLEGTGEERLAQVLRTQKAGEPFSIVVHDQLWEQYKHYLVVGGLPKVVMTYAEKKDSLLTALTEVRDVQEKLLFTYLADMAKHSGKEKAAHIEMLWRHIPSQIAREQEGSVSKFVFKNVIPGVSGYNQISGPLGWLESAGLVKRVSIVNTAEMPLEAYVQTNTFKIYIFDTGILGTLSKLPPATIMEYGFGRYQGAVAENFVTQEFAANGLKDLYGWNGRTAEIEFVIQTQQGITPVEVKSGQRTRAKSLTIFEQTYKPKTSFILSGQNTHEMEGTTKRQFIPLYAAGTQLVQCVLPTPTLHPKPS